MILWVGFGYGCFGYLLEVLIYFDPIRIDMGLHDTERLCPTIT
jgi:hypothetical protein